MRHNHTYRLDAEPWELRDLVSLGPWAVGVVLSAARALQPAPRGSLNRVVPKATHLTILDYSAQQRTLQRGCIYGLRWSELFAEDELEVDRLFAAVSSQFEQAYNNDYTSKAVESVCSRRRGSLTRK